MQFLEGMNDGVRTSGEVSIIHKPPLSALCRRAAFLFGWELTENNYAMNRNLSYVEGRPLVWFVEQGLINQLFKQDEI
jgi:hypothetical protein